MARKPISKPPIIDGIKHPAVVETREEIGEAGGGPPTGFLADGGRLVRRALEARAPVRRLFFLEPIERAAEARLLREARRQEVECYRAPRGLFFKILGLGYETSVRVLAVVDRSPLQRPILPEGERACLLVGETVQDPRNVGVLVRTADAWRHGGVAFSRDSADPYCRAAVRSSTGSVFRVPLALLEDLPDHLRGLSSGDVRIIGTSAHAELPLWDADLKGRCTFVMGNEGEGMSERTRRACDQVVTIPMSGGADSFNITVAAGIVLYEHARQNAPAEGGRRF